jgi:hypothetical protein
MIKYVASCRDTLGVDYLITVLAIGEEEAEEFFLSTMPESSELFGIDPVPNLA